MLLLHYVNHYYRHRIEIEEIIECARKELSLELQLNSVEEEWTEQVYVLLPIVGVCLQ